LWINYPEFISYYFGISLEPGGCIQIRRLKDGTFRFLKFTYSEWIDYLDFKKSPFPFIVQFPLTSKE
jgi:hypothetical protein